MALLQAADMYLGEGDAAYHATRVRTRIAAFRELSRLVRGEDTGVVIETMSDYAVSNAERDLAAVRLAPRELPR